MNLGNFQISFTGKLFCGNLQSSDYKKENVPDETIDLILNEMISHRSILRLTHPLNKLT